MLKPFRNILIGVALGSGGTVALTVGAQVNALNDVEVPVCTLSAGAEASVDLLRADCPGWAGTERGTITVWYDYSTDEDGMLKTARKARLENAVLPDSIPQEVIDYYESKKAGGVRVLRTRTQ